MKPPGPQHGPIHQKRSGNRKEVKQRKALTPKAQIPKLSKFYRIWSKPTILESVTTESRLRKTAYRQPGTEMTKKS